jgi:hypothetical protein
LTPTISLLSLEENMNMISGSGLAAIVRILFTAAVLLAAGCVSGCGSYDVGPDPLPWSPVDEAPPSSGK